MCQLVNSTHLLCIIVQCRPNEQRLLSDDVKVNLDELNGFHAFLAYFVVNMWILGFFVSAC